MDNFVEFTKEDASCVSIHVDEIHTLEEQADRTLVKCCGGHEYLVVDAYTTCREKIDEIMNGDDQDVD